MIGVFGSNRAESHDAWRKSVLMGAVICLSGALAACGGGDDDETVAATSGALTISGTPAAQALQGQQYSFTPSVTPSGGTLTFSITGTPAWATFTASNGRLSGAR